MNPCVTEQSLIRSEIHFVKDHNNKYTTPSIGFQSASFAMKKKTVGFQPRKRNIGFQSSQRSHLGHEATSNSLFVHETRFGIQIDRTIYYVLYY